MQIIVRRFLQSSILFAFILLTNIKLLSQTPYWEQLVIENLPTYINDINNHLSPFLGTKDRTILKNVKVQIELSKTEYTASSDSKRRVITFSSNLIKSIVRFSIAQLIELDTLNFNRKRFGEFYTSIYPSLDNTIIPEIAAELTDEQITLLKEIINTYEFRWIVEKKFMFVYLHELSHQLQDYSKKSKEIKKKKISQEKRDSLLLLLEIEADNFATDKLAQMNIDPTECEDVLSLFLFIKETRFMTVRQLTKRKLNFFEYCYNGFGCSTNDDSLCKKIKNKYLDYLKLNYHYEHLLNLDNLLAMRKNALIDSNVHSIYHLADFYFKGTSEHISNLDSAIYYYQFGANLKLENERLYGATSKSQLISIIEYCQVLTAKIYELKLHDKQSAIKYFEQAMKTAVFLPKEYYEKNVQRLWR